MYKQMNVTRTSKKFCNISKYQVESEDFDFTDDFWQLVSPC